jgi:hypothetical protein
MLDTELTRQIIGAAIEVHRLLGPGLLESAYEDCLCHELALRGLHFEKQKPLPLVYKGTKLECGFRLPISGHELALFINFRVPVLRDGVRRFVTPKQSPKAALNTEVAKSTEKRTSLADA